MKGLNPVQKFAVYGGLCIAGLSTTLGFASAFFVERHLRESEWADTAAVVAYELDVHNLTAYWTDPRLRQEPAKYREAFRPFLRLPEVVRIKLWDREARVLWSEDDQLIGNRFPENAELKEALAGRIAVGLKKPGKLEGKYAHAQAVSLAEIYVPVRSKGSGEVIGVVEVYKQSARMFAAIQEMQRVNWGIAIAGGILLYVVLLPTVRRSYRTQCDLEARLREYTQDLERVVQERTRSLRHLNALSQLVASSLDHQQVLDSIVGAATELIQDSVVSIWILDEATRELTRQACLGMRHPTLPMPTRIPLGVGLVGEAAGTGRPLIVGEVAADPRAENAEWSRAEGLHSGLWLPLSREGRSLGVLSVLGRFDRAFTESEMDLLASLGSQAAIAIENALLYEDVRTRERETSRLYEVTRELASSLEVEHLLDLVTAKTIELLGCDAAGIYRYDDSRGGLTFHRGIHLEPELTRDLVLKPGEGVAGRAFQERRPVWTRDRLADASLQYTPSADRLIRAKAPRAYLATPIISRGDIKGVLVAYSLGPHDYTPKEVQLLCSLADHAAIAIENARLYDTIQRHAAELEDRVRQRTAELEEALRVKSHFLANMSHELRTPLNFVIGFSELLQGGTAGPLNPKQANYLGRIHAGGKRLLELVTDLLDMAETQTGHGDFRLDRMALRELLDEVLDPLTAMAQAKSVWLETVLDPGLPAVVADRRMCSQILHHLVTNAIRYTPAGGRVVVSARQISTVKGEEAEIAVQDTGIGIRPGDLERIFRPFEQADGSDNRQYGGAGLGLALVRRLVALHGGRVWAESEGEGRGARFIVRLPLLPAPPPLRILVVEDEVPVREALCAALTAASYGVDEVSTGIEALERLAANPPNLLVLDIGLPDVDGRDLLKRLRADAQTRDLPILVLSGLDSIQLDQMLKLGADEFLTKPVSPQVLSATVARLLKRPPREVLRSEAGMGAASPEGTGSNS